MIRHGDRGRRRRSRRCSSGRRVGENIELNILIGQKRLDKANALGWRHGLGRAVDGSDGNVDRTGWIVSCHSRWPHDLMSKQRKHMLVTFNK